MRETCFMRGTGANGASTSVDDWASRGTVGDMSDASSQGKVLVMTPEKTETSPGSVVAMYPEDVQPFGSQFLEEVPQAASGTTTGTTATVSVTLGPDVDTDPPDSDSD